MGFLTRSSPLFSEHLLSACHPVMPWKCHVNKTWLMLSRTSGTGRGTHMYDSHVCKLLQVYEKVEWRCGHRSLWIRRGKNLMCLGRKVFTQAVTVTFARGMNEEGKFGGLISRKSISNWGQGRGWKWMLCLGPWGGRSRTVNAAPRPLDLVLEEPGHLLTQGRPG